MKSRFHVWTAIILALVLCLSLLPLSAFAEGEEPVSIPEETGEEPETVSLLWEVTEDSVTVTGISEDFSGDKLVIPAYLGDLPVTAVAEGAFTNLTGLERVSFPETLESIGAGAFAGCSALLNVEFAGLPPVVGEGAFAGADGDFAFFYSANEEAWLSACGNTFYFYGLPCYSKIQDGKVCYAYSGIDDDRNNTRQTYVLEDYTDEYFTSGAEGYTPATTFNYDLAVQTMSLVLGATCRSDPTDGYVRQMLEKFGFENDYYQYRWGEATTTEDDCGYVIAWKELEDGTPLVLVLSRMGYDTEWGSNCHVVEDPDNNPYSIGFYDAAKSEVYGHTATIGGVTYEGTGILGYLEENGLDPAETKIWVSGFSRAGAISNNAGAMLNESGLFQAENLYIYTYASPRTVLEEYAVAYPNVFNIVSEMDVVPQVPLQRWTYTRHGTTYSLPCQAIDGENFAARLSEMKPYFKQMTGVEYNVLYGQEIQVDDLVDVLWETFPTQADYYGEMQDFLVELARSTLGKSGEDIDWKSVLAQLLSGNAYEDFIYLWENYESMSALEITAQLEKLKADMEEMKKLNTPGIRLGTALLEYCTNLDPTRLAYVIGLKDTNNSAALMQHWPEEYLSWLRTGTMENTLSSTGYVRYTSESPIDIYVYDNNRRLVASIVGGVVNEGLNRVLVAFTNTDGSQTVVVPTDGTYEVEVAQSTDPEEEITVSEYNIDGDVISEEVVQASELGAEEETPAPVEEPVQEEPAEELKEEPVAEESVAEEEPEEPAVEEEPAAEEPKSEETEETEETPQQETKQEETTETVKTQTVVEKVVATVKTAVSNLKSAFKSLFKRR